MMVDLLMLVKTIMVIAMKGNDGGKEDTDPADKLERKDKLEW